MIAHVENANFYVTSLFRSAQEFYESFKDFVFILIYVYPITNFMSRQGLPKTPLQLEDRGGYK